MTTIGSLFSGMGGLDQAVEAVTGGTTIWHSEVHAGANTVLRHHWPEVPNLGDIAAIDWASAPPVDVLVGGFPCQDVSNAGRRGGLIRYGTRNRSGLWAHMAQAIDHLRPRMVVAENVRGLTSVKSDADLDLFNCQPCMVDRNGRSMRALGAVLGDLAGIGYDAAWHGVRASDAGAPHQRFRVFILAWPADTDRPRLAFGGGVGGDPRAELPPAVGGDLGALNFLPTPDKSNGTRGGGRLPAERRAGGHSVSLNDVAEAVLAPLNLLPTPRCQANGGAGGLEPSANGVRPGGTGLNLATVINNIPRQNWGIYGPAIARWEAITRPAPPPTETGPRGGQRLAAPFVEFMMGLPEGHVTDPAIGLIRNEQLKILGNGVVPQQAELALRYLFAAIAAAEVA